MYFIKVEIQVAQYILNIIMYNCLKLYAAVGL